MDTEDESSALNQLDVVANSAFRATEPYKAMAEADKARKQAFVRVRNAEGADKNKALTEYREALVRYRNLAHECLRSVLIPKSNARPRKGSPSMPGEISLDADNYLSSLSRETSFTGSVSPTPDEKE